MEFCYIESKITKNGRGKRDIKCRAAVDRKIFLEEILFTNITYNFEYQKRLLKVGVWIEALYGSETGIIGISEKRTLRCVKCSVSGRC